MTDFVTVLRRAVGNLEDNSEQSRQALYEKARTALLGQLRGLDPPLSEAELERQSDDLDAAIAQVEAEFSSASEAPAADPVIAPAPPPLADHAEHVDAPSSRTGAEPATSAETAEPSPARPAESFAAPAESPVSGGHASFRSAIADTAALGTATSSAARAARETYQHLDGDDFAPERGEPVNPEPAPDHDAAAAHDARNVAPAADGPKVYDAEYDDDPPARGLGMAVWVIVFLMVAGIAGAAYWQRDALLEVAGSFGGVQEDTAEIADEMKVDERVPTGTAEAPEQPAPPAAGPDDADTAEVAPTLPQDAARVAQALLVEEGPGGSMSSLGGSVDWTLLDDPEAPEGAQKVIRGTVQIPDKNMSLTLAFRRNLDQELPATHTVELFFDLPPDFESGGIAGVAGLVMKATPQSTGQPLIGALVPVTDDFYLLGLSESSYDRARNIDEMKRRNFIDIPLAYADESRAILSIAKGESGNEVFARAFEAWGQ